MNEKAQVDSIILAIERIHELLEQFPQLVAEVETTTLEKERDILLFVEKQIILPGWFNKFATQYFLLKKQHLDDAAIVLSLKYRVRMESGFNTFVFNGKLKFYLKREMPSDQLERKVYSFILELVGAINTIKKLYEFKVSDSFLAAEKVFWESFKPRKTAFQRTIILGPHKAVTMRFIFLPSSNPVDLLGFHHDKEKPTLIRFADLYCLKKITPEDIINQFFKHLCSTIQKILLHPTITRFYGNTFKINIQIEMRNMRGRGLFSILLRKKRKIEVRVQPNHHDLTVSIMLDYLFDYENLDSTMYHEIIHNLDRGVVTKIDQQELATVSLLRAELITILLESLEYNSSVENRLILAQELWQMIRNKKVSSFSDLSEILQNHDNYIHTLSFLVGLQLLSSSLKITNTGQDPQTMFNAIISKKKQATTILNVISSLSTKKFYIYYKKKVPTETRYFTDEFLDEVIPLL